jgi:hypothetical protein
MIWQAASAFAEEATSKEILEVFDTFITDALFAYNSDVKYDENGNLLTPLAELRLRERLVSLRAAGAIPAFTPQQKFVAKTFCDSDTQKKYQYQICHGQFMLEALQASSISTILENPRELRCATRPTA